MTTHTSKQALLSEDHPTVKRIYLHITRDYSITSLVTNCQTMALLVEVGEVVQVDSTNYATHYHGFRPYQHPHLTCVPCGRGPMRQASMSRCWSTSVCAP
ncbi:MAG: transcriptional repressor [Anaerolineae bacterium]